MSRRASSAGAIWTKPADACARPRRSTAKAPQRSEMHLSMCMYFRCRPSSKSATRKSSTTSPLRCRPLITNKSIPPDCDRAAACERNAAVFRALLQIHPLVRKNINHDRIIHHRHRSFCLQLLCATQTREILVPNIHTKHP